MLIGWWISWRTVGALPFAGSWADQPAYLSDAFAVAEHEAAKIAEERRPKAPPTKAVR